jgi:isopentenyl-diphosphate Delta-isomerase
MTQITDKQEELLTQVDMNNVVLGSIPRGIAHNTADIFYRTIYIIVKDDQDRILLQQRSATKDLYPNCWDLSVGGHVNFGKSYIETAKIELQEELGIVADEAELKFLGEVLVKQPQNGEFFYVYEYKLKASDDIKLQSDEVTNIKWITFSELKLSMKDNPSLWYTRPLQVVEALY